ncbi:hypothetical protein EsHS_00006101 [Epichloe bromicola]
MSDNPKPKHSQEISTPGWHGDEQTPVVDGKYYDRKTGELRTAIGHQEYSGPPAVDILIKSQHVETADCCSRSARPFPVTALLCHMMRVVEERKLEIDSLVVTTYAIRLILDNEMTKEEFYEAADKMSNGIWDTDGYESNAMAKKHSAASAALLMLPLCLSVLLSALDVTIVTPAIPTIVKKLPPLNIWGRKPIMLIAIAIFLCGSLLCALSPTMDALIAGRVIQGIGAAGMGTMVNVIICDTFSMRDRGLFLGITSLVWALGSAVCPILGGLLTTKADIWGIQLQLLPLYRTGVLLAALLAIGSRRQRSGFRHPSSPANCGKLSLSAAFAGICIQKTGKYLRIMYAGQVLNLLGMDLLVYLPFEKDLAKLFVFQILVGLGVGMNIEPPLLAVQAVNAERDTAAVVATMSFVRSIANAISIVELGAHVAQNFNGDQALAKVDVIRTLPQEQQLVVRQTFFHCLRAVWIMYVAFAGLSLVLNFFVRSHHLSTENQEAVLGADRGNKQDKQGTELQT